MSKSRGQMFLDNDIEFSQLLNEQDIEEGKMSDALGIPSPDEREESLCQAYDGSPEDAVEDLRDAIGDEEEVASMVALPANSLSEDDECYGFFQGMQDYIDETEGPGEE